MGDSNSDSDADDIEEFSGIKQPSLLQQIKTILDEYRNDVQIIKELVQNADDAEATKMGILYESNTGMQTCLKDLKYGKFLKTPALIFYNDAEFTDDDWEGIRAIYSSVKKDDPLKIGRFGLGFKSVFHMTDTPCIISGKNALFIDPHERQSDKVCAMMKLKNWKKTEYRGYFDTLKGTFGFSDRTVKTGKYQGTLFWFPLRQTPSSLSDDIYSESEVLHLLEAFINESSRSLLFLKTLCSVNMFVSLPGKDCVSPPPKRMKLDKSEYSKATTALESMNLGKNTACYSVEIGNSNGDLVQKKLDCLYQLKENGHRVPKESMHWTFDVFVKTERKSKNEDVKVAKARWLVVNYLKGGEIAERTKELMEDEDLRYLHLVGLAAPINEECVYVRDAGHVFCYQPLPQDSSLLTKLPVHLNAFFALSQNRRQIRWPDENDTSQAQGDKKIEWNLALAAEMFPEAYYKLVTELVEQSKREENAKHLVKAVYNSIPNLEAVDHQWKEVAESYIASCNDQDVLYTKKDGGSWISLQTAVLADFNRFPTIGKRCKAIILDLLLTDGVPVVTAPEHVMKSLEAKFPDLTYVTPSYVRSHMRNNMSYKSLTSDRKQELLRFVMLELSQHSLDDLELLPLADYTHTSFSGQDHVFLEDVETVGLFPGKENEFVSTGVKPEIEELLSKLADEAEYCVQRMTDDAMVRLLQATTKTDNAIVIPIEEKEKWMTWVRSIWKLIQVRFEFSVHKFTGFPIFPVEIDYDTAEVPKFCLLRLQSNMLFVPSLEELEDKDSICRSMRSLTVTVTGSIPDWLNYNLVRLYLPQDTSEGLVSLFAQIKDNNIEEFNNAATNSEAAALLKFVSERIHSNVSRSKKAFQQLKQFRGYTTQDEWQRVTLTECNKLYEGKQIPVKFPEQMLRIESEKEVSFARSLDVQTLSESAVVIKALENIDNYSVMEKQVLMRWIVKEESLFDQITVQEYMRKIKFLKASDGKVYRPCELFDSTDNQLMDLFKGQSVFPVINSEIDHQYMMGLRKLGLKSRDQLTSHDIEKVSTEVQEIYQAKSEIDQNQCLALLSLMNEKSHLVMKDTILNTRCIMVKTITDENYPKCIPLKNNSTPLTSILCSPSDIKSSEFIYLVGSVTYMLNCESLPDLSHQFGWQTQPPVDKVLDHLLNVVQGFDLDYKSTCLSMIVKVYEWMSKQSECGTEKVRELMKCKFASTDERFVWVGDGFKAPNHVYVDENEADIGDMRPLLNKLPTELSNLQKFFVGIGCRQSLEFDMYLDTLYRIKEECEAQLVRTSHVKLRKLAIAILNKIHDDFTGELRNCKKELLFPVIHEENEKLCMKPIKQCTFCDAQWLKDMEVELDEDIFYVHPEVPSATAESLGVPSLRQQMLSNTEAFEEWGQEEPLTRRLRNLLKDGYVDGFSVAKELFQNADDAKATELCILFDERENNDAKTQLISDGMRECQGPALWVYNDAKFAEDDFRNITKLSGGTKENDSTKIGKFGLGFCSVYNVTDVPSFVSGDNVVIFDPHTTFLGKALPGNSPGLRINFQVMKNRNMMKRLKNQFKPFDKIFGCSMTDGVAPSIDGTLFRLPLRNKASDISDTVYTPSEVKELFGKIMLMAANMLLFSQNVSAVKLFHLSKSKKDPLECKILYEARKETKQMRSNSNFIGPVLAEASKRKENKTLSENPISLLEKVTIKVTVDVASTFHIPHILKTDGLETVSNWLVSWSTGSCEEMLQLAYEEKGAINLAAVAVPVHFSEDTRETEICSLTDLPTGFYKTGHLYFFLPLPIEHSFPFHVNSQFSVTTDRKHLQISSEDDKNKRTKEWNENLLKDPVTRALLYLLEGLPSLGPLRNFNFDQLWPRNESNPTVKCLQYSFYKNVATPEMYKVFEKDGSWFDISRCVFIDFSFRQSCAGNVAFEVLSSLTQFVIEVPADIYSSLLEANETLIQEKTVTEEMFYLKYFLPNLKTFQGEMITKRNVLLRYAITCTEKYCSIRNWLRSNECIPSEPNGMLQCPADLINPGSALAKLFCTSDGRFPDGYFSEKNILDLLGNIGLISEFLPDTLVDDRARSIKTLQSKCSRCAVERVGHLLVYLCENSTKHIAVFSTLQTIPFIPVMRKPHEWQYQWYADNLPDSGETTMCNRHISRNFKLPQVSKFINAKDIFYYTCKDIVGCVQFIFEEGVCRVSDRDTTDNRIKLKQVLNSIGMKGIPTSSVETDLVIKQLEVVASQKFNVSVFNKSVLPAIYDHLEDACRHGIDSDKINRQLKEKPIIYVSDTFTLPKYVAKHIDRDCKPFLFKLDESPLRSCSKLCQCLGIIDTFNPIDMLLLIQQLKLEKGDIPLSNSEIRALINILSCFATSLKRPADLRSIIGEKVEAIFGPDEQGILRDCTTMCFNDDFDDIEKSETMIYVHEDFPARLAKRLGVKPKAIQNLEDQSEDIEDFYQEEPLITRLQRLLEGYPCDGIFKELLQNADDAKATEIVFIKDYVTHPTNNIVDSAFEPLQGQALCVFNDSAFSNEDLKGIQRLGRGSKSEDPSQTGRYGVGFNAVYNITDAPSFYTKGGEIENGETICFFDPLAKFIPNVSRQKPGKRYKNVKAIKRYHSDMISGYHANRFLHDRGTVFRFPLRTPDMEKSSEIKQDREQIMDIKAVTKLLDEFSNELGEVVLFLKNLRTVRVLTHTSDGYEEDFSISLHLNEEDTMKKDEIRQHCGELCKEMKDKKYSVIDYPQRSSIYELCATEKWKDGVNTQRYVIVETLGFKEGKNIPPLLRQAFLDGKIGLSPHGGVAFRTDTPENYNFQERTVCKAFCFLPLPVLTRLPVHVHGYFSLDHESRRTLWKSDRTETCYKSLWNEGLIEFIIAPAYVKLLEYIKGKMFKDITGKQMPFSTVSRFLSNYQTLFPLHCKLDDYYWKHLMCCVYKELIAENISFLPCQETTSTGMSKNPMKMTNLNWTPLRINGHTYPAYVMQESGVDSESNADSDFNNILRRIGMKIAFITDDIISSMKCADVEISFVKPETLIDFLCTFNSSDVDKCKIETEVHLKETALCSIRDVETIFIYCLKEKENLFKRLTGVPLMITQDNIVHVLPINGQFYVERTGRFNFFPGKEHLFLHVAVAGLLCRHYKNALLEINSLKQFCLQEFVSLVEETGIVKAVFHCLSWNKKSPDKKWIRLFWEFFWHLFPRETHQEKKDFAKRQLQLVRSLPLIPALESFNEMSLLVPPCDMKRLINVESFTYELQEIFAFLQIPVIDETVFWQGREGRSDIVGMLLELIPNNACPSDVLECLHINVQKLNNSGLSKWQAKAMLGYFNGNCRILNAAEKLRDLPLFETHLGELVAISDYENRVVVERYIPKDGLGKVTAAKANVLFLTDTGMQQLFECLKIKTITWIEVYERYIIPNEQCLQREEFYKHIKFLSQHILSADSVNIPLLNLLRCIPFIETLDKKRVKVSELFDPSHSVFAIMCDKSELVPESLKENGILKLFRLIGLQTKMTMELFIKFARKIEESGNSMNSPVYVPQKSKILVDSLLHMNKMFYAHEIFDELLAINFITPFIIDANTSAIHPQFKSNRLVCFEGSVLKSSRHISWTITSILPDEADPTLQNQELADQIIDKLHICKAPNLEKLIQHCIKVGESLSAKLKDLSTLSYSTVNDVMSSIYKALDGHSKADTLTSDSVKPLETVPIVYSQESRSIHLANRVVNSCRDEEEIQPYLNKCPSDLAQYHSVFLQLGTKKEPTAGVYADVLNDITCSCGVAKHLLPKESSDVKKAMELFFKYLIQENEEVQIKDSKLFLLSKDETLDAAQMLIFGNNKYFEKQLAKVPTDHVKFVFPIEKLPGCKLKVEDCVDSIQQLPQKCRPHLLSDLVSERVILSNIVNKDGKTAEEVGHFIHSRFFVEGFLRLIRHVYRSNNKSWNDEEEKRLATHVQNVRFQHASGIETTLSLACIKDGKVGNEMPIENTKESKSVHLEAKRDTGTVCVYFDTSDQKWFSDLTRQFTVYLNSLVSKCLKDETLIILMEMIGMKDSPKKINDFLSKEKIEEYTATVEINEGPIYPVPGTFVPKCLHDYLDNNCGVIYEYEYKFIAFEVEDPAFTNEDSNEVEIEEDPTYIFVHIIRKLEQSCSLPLFQEYEINDGTENTQIVKAYQLFKFVRKSVSDTSNQKELMLYTGVKGAQDTLSFKEAKSEIRKYLIEAWKKTEMERRKIVKRLLLKWHPDKNPDTVEFCTKIFQYIQQCLIRLENGDDLIDDESDADKDSKSNYSSSQNWSSTWYGRYWKRHKRRWRNNPGSGRSFNGFDDWWSFRRTDTAEEEEPYHWHSEARRWMRQAESDIRNAEASLKEEMRQAESDIRNAEASLNEESGHSFNWICYKAHQGAEKSLKAAWYAENANKIWRVKYSHDLTRIASGLHTDIAAMASRLSYEAGDHSRMRYPDMFSGQQIPADAYTREKALKVISIAREIFSAVRDKHVK